MATTWSYGAVAFIDVLGFSALVSSDARSTIPAHLDKLRTLLAKVKESSPKLDVRAFSDSITIAAPLATKDVEDLFESIVSLQQMFVMGGALVRGGVAFGKHFADDTSLSGILCARHSMTTRSMNATQYEDRCGGQGSGAANSG